MTQLGRNVKLTVDADRRGEVRSMYQDVFGCERLEPTPSLDVFRFEEGGQVGVYYASNGDAPSPTDGEKGIWLEYVVEDAARAAKQLEALGLEQVGYHDKAHVYFRAPGGHVFRIASR
jgi:catechol 2,3-dioxygenase-like lactoylglutathione lyase family enzyme